MTATVTAGYAGVRVLVLGGTGFLGRGLVRLLVDAAADLHCVVRPSAYSRQRLDLATVHSLDLVDLDQTASLVKQLRPAVVFNLAGYGVDPDEKQAANESLARRLNADLPESIARAVAEIRSNRWIGRQIVHVGSIAEYGPISGQVSEGIEPRPAGIYGETKLGGTVGLARAARETGVQALTARLAQVYGPGEHAGRLLPQLIAARLSGRLDPLTVGTQRKDFTFVADVAEGLLRLGLTPGIPGECVNLATGRCTPVRDFVIEAAYLLRLPTELLRFERPIPPGELSHDSVAIDRLRSLAGWIPTTEIREGISRTIAVELPSA